MNCVGIFADFVFKVVSQLTRVIQPQNKRSIFQRDDISYILFHIWNLFLNCRNSSMIQTTYHFRRKPGAYFKNWLWFFSERRPIPSWWPALISFCQEKFMVSTTSAKFLPAWSHQDKKKSLFLKMDLTYCIGGGIFLG